MAEQPSQEQINSIADALAAGRKLDAIKIYREATGKGLKDAKDFIDALVPRLKEQDPQKYANLSAQGAGCSSAILVCLAIAWIVKSWAIG